MSRKKIAEITDLTPDPENANEGTERGLAAVEDSLRKFGAGRAPVADRSGIVIAGNKTIEQAAALGFNIRTVHTDGKELVVVVREDLDLSDDKEGRARGLALADNRSSELGLKWNVEQVLKHANDGVPVQDAGFSEKDLQSLQRQLEKSETKPETVLDQAVQLKPTQEYVVITAKDLAEWEELKKLLDLQPVRRGGYKPGSPFDAVATQRVVPAEKLLALMKS